MAELSPDVEGRVYIYTAENTSEVNGAEIIVMVQDPLYKLICQQPMSYGASGGDGLYYSHETGRKKYEISNHLGNVHLVVSDKKVGQDSLATQSGDGFIDHYTAQVVDASDYYPFGWYIQDRKIPLNSVDEGGYRFGFNGKEKDDEIKGAGNSLDFGERIYDPRIGRWLTGDPMNQFASPYSAMANNPISLIDPSGGYVPLSMAKRFRWEEETSKRGYMDAFNDDFIRNMAGEFGFGMWASFEKRAYEMLERSMMIASIMDELQGKGGPCEHMPEGDSDALAEIYSMAYEIFSNKQAGLGYGAGGFDPEYCFNDAIQEATEKYENTHGDPPGNEKIASGQGEIWYYGVQLDKSRDVGHSLVRTPDGIIYEIIHPNYGQVHGFNSWLNGGPKVVGYRYDMSRDLDFFAFWDFGEGRKMITWQTVYVSNPQDARNFFESWVNESWDYNFFTNNCKHYIYQGLTAGGAYINFNTDIPVEWPGVYSSPWYNSY